MRTALQIRNWNNPLTLTSFHKKLVQISDSKKGFLIYETLLYYHVFLKCLCFQMKRLLESDTLYLPQYLLATFNYRARGTFGPSTLNYLLNGVANA